MDFSKHYVNLHVDQRNIKTTLAAALQKLSRFAGASFLYIRGKLCYNNAGKAGEGMQRLERIRGCLLGGAAGDALGYAVEFIDGRTIRDRYGPLGIRHYELEDGLARISDDTQMTLFTCEGIVMGWNRAVAGGMATDMEVYVHDAYMNWLCTQGYRQQGMWRAFSYLMQQPEMFHQRAPGGTCLGALLSGRMGSLREPVNMSKGCGGVMRVAPMGFVGAFGRRYDDAPENAPLWQAAKVAAITHGHPMGYMPAAMLAEMIRLIALENGMTLEEITLAALEKTERLLGGDEGLAGMELHSLTRKAMALSRAEENDWLAIRSLGEGWVGEEALAIALYCVLKYRQDFSACIRAAVNHDGDSDSTGAIAGNLLGAWLGAGAIGEEWLAPLEGRHIIETMACQLDNVVKEQQA